MAYTVEVTKTGIDKINDNLLKITVSANFYNGSVMLFSQNAVTVYNKTTMTITQAQNALTLALINAWDKWVTETTLFNSAAFNNAVINIQNAITTHING